MFFLSCCTTEEMSDSDDEDDDWNELDPDDFSQHSTSTSATAADQEKTANSSSSKDCHAHSNIENHTSCSSKSTCEGENDTGYCGPGRNKRLCCCCYNKMFPDEHPSNRTKSRNHAKSATKERLRNLLSEKKKKEAKAEKEAILKRKIRILSMEKVDERPVDPLVSENQKLGNVDKLLDFIEGNIKQADNAINTPNYKKKAKKERQKQQRIEEIQRKKEEEKRVKEEQENERQRLEEEKRKQEEEERLRVKKMNKKATQKAKKLADKGQLIKPSNPEIVDNLDAMNKSMISNQDNACITCYDETLTPTETLEHIKEQHLKDFQQLQQFHRLVIDNVFLPKDIDLDNREMDDVEREVEAFKRFCFNSVPLQQKPKVDIDMRKISVKKIEKYGGLVVAKQNYATRCCDM